MRYPLISELAKALQAPVCILDLETTGIHKNPIRGIVDFAYIKVEPNGRITEFESLLNPLIPIHPEASATHGLFEQDIKNSPKFDSVADMVQDIFKECIVSGFNTRSFDVNVLVENLAQYGYSPLTPGRQLDVRDIWRKITGAQKGCLSDVAEHFKAQKGTAHRAYGDVLTTTNILEAMILNHGLQLILQDSWPTHAQTKEHPPERIPLIPKITLNTVPVVPAVKSGTSRASSTSSNETWFVQKTLFDADSFNPPRNLAESEDTRAKNCIKRHLIQHDRLSLEDYKKLAKEEGVSVSSISYAVSQLLSSKQIDWRKITNPDAQQLLRPVISKIKTALPSSAGLKIMKAYAEAELGQTVDYNQLRIALMTHRRHA